MALTKKQREGVVDTFLSLLSERPWDEIALSEVADAAKVSLADLAAAFPSKVAIWEAFVQRIDQEVMKDDGSDMAEEIPRERLFDVMMRRFDALRPHRDAMRNLMRAARGDPGLALELNRLALRSHAWMLAVARIEPGGLEGRALAQGSALVFARVLRTFLSEEDPGMPKTMAALDRELRQAEERWGGISRVIRFFSGGRRRTRGEVSARPMPPANGNGADRGANGMAEPGIA
jgi:AcrR family transcriptional regulator